MTLSSPGSIRTLSVYQTALVAIRAGISFIPIQADGSKRPDLQSWKEFQRRVPTLQEARIWFYGKQRGIAFVTGAVSGGLEMLDFDSHAAYEEFIAHMHLEGLTWLLERIEQGYKEFSPKGVHLYYRCALIEGNKKLAQCSLQEPPWVISKIETRGEGGYSIGAPSCGRVHPSGQPYQLVAGNLATIQTIAQEDRAVLLSVARMLDEMPVKEEQHPRDANRSYKKYQSQHGERLPGHVFNERITWAEILEPHGWTRVTSIGNEDFWRRPGKDRGISASTNYEGSDFLYVFSTSTIFEPRVGISKFAAYTFLEHGGDFSEAAKALVAQGYVDERNDHDPTSVDYGS
ncbi:bifunctional DNA primase/polymerase [Ktedonobacteria bacterium brp13]|nr:bifunctional DNA primase/polymerase [Ktedonobacteria bacterium brp13]